MTRISYPPPKFVYANLREDASAEDNGAALAAAIEVSNTIDAATRIQSGNYLCNLTTTESLRLMADPGARLINTYGQSAIKVDHLADVVGPYAVSAFAFATHPNQTNLNADLSRITLTTPAEAANFEPGDAIWVGSRDVRTYNTNRSGLFGYAAETAIVEAVNVGSGFIYIRGKLALQALYVTQPVVRRLARNKQVVLSGFEIACDNDPYGTYGAGGGFGAIQLIGCVRPIVENVRIVSSFHAGIEVKTGLMPIINGVHVVDAPGNPDDGRFGYGVVFNGAVNAGRVTNSTFERCRHGFTTDNFSEATNNYVDSRWYLYGDPTYTIVEDSAAVGCGGTGFDTHEASFATIFKNCTAIGGTRDTALVEGDAPYAPGFSIRGAFDSILNCVVRNCELGVVVESTAVQIETALNNSLRCEVVVDGLSVINDAVNNHFNSAVSVLGIAATTNPASVKLRNINCQRVSRAVYVNPGYLGDVTISDSVLSGFYDLAAELDPRGALTCRFANVGFDCFLLRDSENLINVTGTGTVANLEFINCWVKPRAAATPGEICFVQTGATLNVTRTPIYNTTGATLVLSAGTGTINVPVAMTTVA